ncbi:hypothetical protein [Bacillus tuaregi]|uniref:hypothetical protein n=1 Tax=Bacillus tuaregi TaxID=1816695 RepID=UPI0008F817EF|nr:hypothetical protein [Bacillus tuaregi]
MKENFNGKEVITIFKLSPYLFILGITLTVVEGLRIFYTYHPYTPYPTERLEYFSIGVILTFISSFFVWRNGKRSNDEYDPSKREKDYRTYINQLWKNRRKLGNLFVVATILGILSTELFFIELLLLIAGIIWSFIFIMRDNEEEDEAYIEKRSRKVKAFLAVVDYRKHPFHLPIILFILIIISFLYANHHEMILNHLDNGDSMYGWSFPLGMITLAAAVFATAFIFIIHNSDFFGIRQLKQNEEKIIGLHFADLGVSGLALFVWLITFWTAN